MNHAPALVLQLGDWLNLFGHYLMLSLLSIGGAITTTPDMHRYLVEQQHWLSDAQFNASVAIAQAAPGPNVLFVALMGWNLGMNAGGSVSGLAGLLVTMTGILLPSTLLTCFATEWAHRNRERRTVRAFKLGMAPVVVGLMLATGWILAASNATHGDLASNWPHWLVTGVTAFVVWRIRRVHLLWLLAAGAALGWSGWL